VTRTRKSIVLAGILPFALATTGSPTFADEPPTLGQCANAWRAVGAADMDGDGKPDQIYLGVCADKGGFAAVIHGQMRVIEFPISRQAQFGMCAKPVSATPGRRSEGPLEATGQYPPAYEECPECAEITVSDDECDSMHFYWRNDNQTIAWWRA
jgi:hypothetical protein